MHAVNTYPEWTVYLIGRSGGGYMALKNLAQTQ
ncbi:hypothetical protein GGD40_005562 [Paraburkholderia bryophila]|uniref:Uncharacterized protein n=1 Tax=Paraburkholderia bryophila TaxID=420952 RepID=A0A7Y9WS51_9BURK|nr:hypothetical protein [Paraburkholderia bryophila]